MKRYYEKLNLADARATPYDLRRTMEDVVISLRKKAGSDAVMPVDTLKTEAELRSAVIDRLIEASLSESKPALEATLERWRTIGAQKSEPDSTEPKAG
jgi:hypothetical protein